MVDATGTERFCDPDRMISALEAQARKRQWPLAAWQLRALAQQVPSLPSGELVSLSFDVWLGNLRYTFEELWQWVSETHKRSWRAPGLRSTRRHLRFRYPMPYGKTPSVSWAVIDLGARWEKSTGMRPKDIDDAQRSAGLELMAAFAVHTRYVSSIDEEKVILSSRSYLVQSTLTGRKHIKK